MLIWVPILVSLPRQQVPSTAISRDNKDRCFGMTSDSEDDYVACDDPASISQGTSPSWNRSIGACELIARLYEVCTCIYLFVAFSKTVKQHTRTVCEKKHLLLRAIATKKRMPYLAIYWCTL